MIYLITGLPGNGKTLYSLWHIRDRAKAENRQVYVSGIPDLNIPEWHQIDEEASKKWFELPPGSIIVIDEAQRIFRPRAGRGEPPEHVSQLETHRHNGYDIYLITQHPSLIDQNVRRLAGTHRHIQRTFGMARAVIHEWGEVHMDCELRRTDSSKTTWSFPKDIYSLYKSAEVHTHKVQMPKQVWYLLAFVTIIGGLSWYVYTRMHSRINPDPKPRDQPGQLATGQITAFAPDAALVLTPAQYAASYTPRIPGLLHTAPRYDKLTEPTDAPYPMGCYEVAGTCKCVTQQGTPYRATRDMCLSIVKNGYFKDWGTITVKNSPEAPTSAGIGSPDSPRHSIPAVDQTL